MNNKMNYVFYVIGACVVYSACTNSLDAESAIHQIYVQLQWITAILLIGFGHLYTCINYRTNEEKQKCTNDEERKAFEQKQTESINKSEK